MKIEVRNGSVSISGYVNAVERESRLIPSPKGPFVEKVRAGAFERALAGGSVELRLDHGRVIGGTGRIAGMQEAAVGSGGGYAAVRPRRGKDRTGYAYGAITNAVENGHAIRRPSGFAKGYRARIRKRYVLGKHFYAKSRTEALRIALDEAGKWADEIVRTLRG